MLLCYLRRSFCSAIQNAGIAQSVEQLIRNQQVAGSNPVTSSKKIKGSQRLPFIFLDLYGFEPLAVATQQQSSARYHSILFYHPIMRADIGSESRRQNFQQKSALYELRTSRCCSATPKICALPPNVSFAHIMRADIGSESRQRLL